MKTANSKRNAFFKATLEFVLLHYMSGMILLSTFFAFSTTSTASEIGFNIYGFSYHPDETDSNGNRFHAFNPGIGLQFTFYESGKHRLLADGGIYRNSTGHHSEYISAGYRFLPGAGFQVGPIVALYHSPDQNSGKAFLAPLLLLGYRYKRVTFQVIPVPRYKDVNRNAAIAMYFTISLHR